MNTEKPQLTTFVNGSALIIESRKCGDCKQFHLDRGANVLGICRKKLMTVTSCLQVFYKTKRKTHPSPLAWVGSSLIYK